MKKSIRIRFILGLTIIFLFSGIALNLLIRQVFEINLENTIKNSMKDIMKNSREYTKYTLLNNELSSSEETFKGEAWHIVKYLTDAYKCESEIRNFKGEILENSENVQFSYLMNKATETAKSGKAVVNINYSENKVNGILSYPLYYKEKYIGIININKEYTEFYISNKNNINIITYVEVGIFLLICILSFLFTSNIIKPIIILTKEVKKVGSGDYETDLEIKNEDEIGALSKEFMDMKQKIKSQIYTINLEKEKVVKLEKGRRGFFNNVTHELKTPLTAISGYAQMLSDKNIEDEQFKNRAAHRIYLESERMHKLVLDLINVSKGVTFKQEEKKVIKMKKLLEQIYEDMAIKSDKYSLKLCKDIKAGNILGQSDKIRQLVINILDNAIKYSFKGQKIFIKAFNKDNFFNIEVSNKGEKIPEDIYNNIFEPFVKTSKPSEIGSSGLGLYICNEIVKEHDGKIEIENDEVIKVKVQIPSLE